MEGGKSSDSRLHDSLCPLLKQVAGDATGTHLGVGTYVQAYQCDGLSCHSKFNEYVVPEGWLLTAGRGDAQCTEKYESPRPTQPSP